MLHYPDTTGRFHSFAMSSNQASYSSRRSTRVPLKVIVEVHGNPDLKCEAETIVVNLHGALIETELPLQPKMQISIRVHLTGKQSAARVVYVDPERPLRCGIELAQPNNIWGVSLPPDDWEQAGGSDGPDWQ